MAAVNDKKVKILRRPRYVPLPKRHSQMRVSIDARRRAQIWPPGEEDHVTRNESSHSPQVEA